MRRLALALAGVSAAAGLAATAFWLGYGSEAGFEGQGLPRLLASLLLLCGLSSGALAIRWLRWHYLTRHLIRPLPTRASLKLYFGTLPAFATPLYVGELLRTAIAARRDPAARGVVFLIWLAERLADSAALGVFLLLAGGHWFGLLFVGAALLVVSLLAKGVRGPSALAALAQPRMAGVLATTSLAAWSLPVLGLWWVVGGSDAVSLGEASGIFSRATLLGGIALIPLGSGVTGSSMIVQLSSAGVGADAAVLGIALFRAGTSWYALGLGVLAFVRWRRDIVSMARAAPPEERFDALAPEYAGQLPAHVQERVVDRKVEVMARRLEQAGIASGARGLEIGCGHGWYAAALAKRGFAIRACDVAPAQVEEARRFLTTAGASAELGVADARELPYPDGCFDFAWAVNVLHHIDAAGRIRALDEVVRVLRPGGSFFLHEINTENPAFTFYMGYVFPVLRDIDDGTEAWIRPSRLPPVAGASWDPDVTYLTFLPDFTPRVLLRAFAGAERALERSPLRRFSAHYVARLVRD